MEEFMTEFEILELGDNACKVEVAEASSQLNVPRLTVPIGLPPLMPDLKEDLEKKFLTNLESLPIHSLDRLQNFLPREVNVENLYEANTTPVQSTIVVRRDPTTGVLLDYEEAFYQDTGLTSRNSTSLKRPPGPMTDNVKGSTMDLPFWPGGLEEPDLSTLKQSAVSDVIDLEGELLIKPPGFSEGMIFERRVQPKQKQFRKETDGVIDIRDIMSQDDDIFIKADNDVETARTVQEQPASEKTDLEEDKAVDDIIKLEHKAQNIYDSQMFTPFSSTAEKGSYEWAIMVDINTPVDDFYKRIPDMAYQWPFELDTFQKQAILHLENHENVFVAAHTSAGKTVVAEYAIALAMKHMTKSVYTSPIKALSNQKFRDFKNTFKDVGLITGDVQLNPEASCLIMTTEILRLMLYNGSQVIRDLEWVIFDEVHYINDAERGVVWEEVLIMLPDHVNIILLSATVPNTMAFADWVGRIKKRKVFVVSTSKRPVPLEHFLYTGNSNKTSNELFLLLDSSKQFLSTGYSKALEAKKQRASKSSQGYGAKGPRGGAPSQDKNIWLSVIDMLRKKDQLPIVAFTFSKKRIEEHAHNTSSLDLLTEKEKGTVHGFYQKCISRLKGTDRELPQVIQMQDLLKRGIGIHHSGVLPILKEVVEMLFQENLVKVLFATETFAMGVNMPARTVVFDSIRKNDGTNFRDLLPGEYIQMAGRAGRRGLDTTGMVIILCKGDVPEMADLHKMMMGRPTQLQSQFRLTYSMILNLLRVDQLRIEDMMKRSFSEVNNQREANKHKEALEEVGKELEEAPEVVDFSGDLAKYYDQCEEYWELKLSLQKKVLSHPNAMKALSSGRVIIIGTHFSSPSSAEFSATLALVLHANTRDRSLSALVLTEQTQTDEKLSNEPQTVSLPKPYVTPNMFRPSGPCGHKVVELKVEHIEGVTCHSVRINADKIADDYKKRQIPRFKTDPPGPSATTATQELLRVVEEYPSGPPTLDPINDLHLRDLDLVEQFQRLRFIEESFNGFNCVQHPGFEDSFQQFRDRRKLQDRYRELTFLLSEESLHLLPEYKQRIQVLRELEYIDDSRVIQLKGRVACEISNHELMITELLFNNSLSHLHPTEIAAMLSAIVFEQKNASEPKLGKDLTQAKEDFIAQARRIGQVQKQCGLEMPVEEYVEQFHFGLMEVVFEWARGMPFSEITGLTDVQEGIIVRCIQRLDETLKDVRNAARLVGDPVLYQKMEEASRMIKRDIVFAASLYTQ